MTVLDYVAATFVGLMAIAWLILAISCAWACLKAFARWAEAPPPVNHFPPSAYKPGLDEAKAHPHPLGLSLSQRKRIEAQIKANGGRIYEKGEQV